MSVTTLRILLVDDEPVARQILRDELVLMQGVEVAGEAASGDEALEQIARRQPDLVLLDLQMPGKGGFDVIRALDPATMPAIVICTAFDQHALEAFDSGAIDYLLKPVSAERLAKCVDRVRLTQKSPALRASRAARLQEAAGGAPAGKPRKITGRLGEEFHLIDSHAVLAFQAEAELVWMITRRQRYLATLPLKAIEERVSGLNFARIHRNSLVNLDHVAKMAPLSSQRWLLTLDDGQEFIVSKRQAAQVRQLLSW
jgi:two-component system, LytTR family, response regulator